MTKFKVDLAELDSVVGSLDAFGVTFASRLSDLQASIEALREDWLGEAAAAQTEAHQRIAAGAADLHAAVLGLHAAARHAHTSYSAAVRANVSTWKQVR